MNNESVAIADHLQCPDCGHKGCYTMYSDGHTYCFSCSKHTPADADKGREFKAKVKHRKKPTGTWNWVVAEHFDAFRGLTESTLRKYGIHHAEIWNEQAIVFDYKDHTGQRMAQKVRLPNKQMPSFVVQDKRPFKNLLFGNHLVGDQYGLVLTEGELDAASCDQLLNSKQWVCLSVPNGARNAAAAVKANMQWLRKFKHVVVAFDMDDVGQEAAVGVQRILGSKARIANLPAKDLNDCLQQGLGTEAIEAILNPTASARLTEEEISYVASASTTYAMNDEGLAQRVVERFGSVIKFVPDGGVWLAWDGKRWQFDATNTVLGYVKKAVEDMAEEAEREDDEDKRKALRKWVHKCGMQGRFEAVVAKLGTVYPQLHASIEEFDQDAWSINCANGVVSLKTGKLVPHAKDLMHTKITNVVYDPDAPRPLWDKCVQDWLAHYKGGPRDHDLEDYVQRMVGYAATGAVLNHGAYWLEGRGRNGKSKFIEAIRDCLGEYAVSVDIMIVTTRQANGRVAEQIGLLRGTRLAYSTESNAASINSEVFKKLTGGDRLRGGGLYKSTYEFSPTHKLVFAANDLPHSNDHTDAFWERQYVVPFRSQWKEASGTQDQNLGDKLRLEEAGILAYVVEGAVKYWQALSSTGRGIVPPKAVVEAIEAYREDCDILLPFVRDYLVKEDGASCELQDIYECYKTYAETIGYGNDIPPLNIFAKRLSERNIKRDRKTINGRKVQIVKGYRLRRENEASDADQANIINLADKKAGRF